MRKVIRINELYESELIKITAERGEWIKFLRFVALHYQYSFDQQLLLYAQRPGATVALPMEDWNLRYGRWVARGSKGIALIDTSRGGGSCGSCSTLRTRWRPIRRARFRGLRCFRRNAQGSLMRWKPPWASWLIEIPLRGRCAPSHRTSCGSGCRKSCGRCWSVWTAVFWSIARMRR